MKLQLIRNATMKIDFGGKTILTDPVFSDRHGIDSFAGIERNPTIGLPVPVEKIIEGIDLIVISHVHRDHFDDPARKLLPKNLPILCQPCDAAGIKDAGFTDVTRVETVVEKWGIKIRRTPGKHAGSRKWDDILGPVSGFIFEAKNEPKVYWAGDTILNEDVKNIISNENPDIILTHSCGAQLEDSGPIVMDAAQTVDVCRLAPLAKIVAVHLEALDHGTVTRQGVRKLADQTGISEDRLIIPDDGQILELPPFGRAISL